MIKKIGTILLIILICYFLFGRSNNISNGVIWNNDDNVTNEVSYIAIPGFSMMVFNDQAENQEVEIFNPEINSCIMDMSICLQDDSIIWHEENIKPGYGFHEIKLNRILKKGIYENSYLLIRCYTDGGDELNGGKVRFTLYVN